MSMVSAGSRHTLGLSSDGEVYSWGWGAQGQLGLGHKNSVVFPTKIESLSDQVTSISAGGIHSACVNSAGQCYTWGSSEYGQLGLGPDVITSLSSPCHVTGENPETKLLFSKVSCGGMHTAAIDLSGDLWCWGRADSGQTGTGKWVFSHFPGVVYPRHIGNVHEVVDVKCGGFHTVVLTKTGTALAMGKEDFGVLGTGVANSRKMKQGTETLIDVAALSGQKIVGISSGGWHSMFWTDDGKLYACGKGEYGRLGTGSEQNIPAPTLVVFEDPEVRVIQASCGGSHSLILTTDSRLYTVGRSDDGRLGLGTVSQAKIMKPVLVSEDLPDENASSEVGRLTVSQVAAGGAHSLILMSSPKG